MHIMAHLWRRRFGIGIGIALFAALAVGAFAAVRAAGPQTRTVGAVTFTFDTVELDNGDGSFLGSGNIKIGPKNVAPVLKVADTGTTPDENDDALVSCINTSGTLACSVVGAVSFLSDSNATPLVKTGFVNNKRETLLVDTTNAKITNAGTVPPEVGVHNASMNLTFLDRALMRPFFGDTSANGTKDVTFVFDLNAKKFDATMPIKLKLNAAAENPNLQITAKLTFTSTGTFSGSVNDFKFKLAALIVNVKTITLKPGEFTATAAQVSKIENPALPPLDPTNNDLLFEFTGLTYKDGDFSISGGAVAIKDWAFSEAFRTINQTIGIQKDATTQSHFFTINSTLSFGTLLEYEGEEPSGTPKNIPIVLKIGRVTVKGTEQPLIEAGLSDFTPTLGPLGFKLKNVVFRGDPSQDFYGIIAQTFEVKWPQKLGGQSASAGATSFKFGIHKAGGVVFEVGGATLTTPELRSSVFKGSFTGSFTAVQSTIVMTLTGNVQLTLPANSGTAATANMILRGGPNVIKSSQQCRNGKSCTKRFEMTLSGFNLKLAGFTLGLTNVQGRDDGGIVVQQASLTLPPGLTGFGGQVNGLTIAGNGDITITGGGVELPPLQIGTASFVGFKGNFAKDADGYEFTGGATLALPGLEPSGTRRIAAEVTVRTTATGTFNGFGIVVSFSARPGIPIASTGMELTTISGGFNLNNGTATINVGLGTESSTRLLSLPLVSLNGQAELKLNPFKLTLGAQLNLLIFKVADAQIQIGDGAGFNGGRGLFASVQVNAVIIHGGASVRIGKVTVNGQDKTRFAISGFYEVGIDKGQFGTLRPPFDIHLFGISFQGGQFDDRRESPARRTAGLLGTIEVGPFNASLFSDFGRNGNVDLVNDNKFTLIDGLQVQQLAAKGDPRFKSRALSSTEAAQLGIRSTAARITQDAITLPVTQTQTAVFGIEYKAGNPRIRLQLPGGGELAEAGLCAISDTNVCAGQTQVFARSAATGAAGNSLAFIIKNAPIGTYTLLIDDAPAGYKQAFYQLNGVPTLSGVSATCGGAAIAGVAVTCGGAAGNGPVVIAWNAADDDSPTAKVRIGYAPVLTDTTTIDPATMVLLANDLPLGSGTFTWNLGDVPSGNYRVVVQAQDDSNAPVTVIDPLVIGVTDGRAPAVPAGLVGTPQPGEMLITWTPNIERDLAGYEIGFGVVQPGIADSAANFKYQRDMGAKEIVLTATGVLDAKLWGLTDNEAIFIGIRAYDQNGNRSEWSAFARGTPWALAPKAWTPTPGGNGTRASVEIAFGTALHTGQNPAALLAVTDGTGTPVRGNVEFLVDVDGVNPVGLKFTPTGPMPNGAYTATLTGGAAGVTAADGRQLPANYTWSFTITRQQLFLPLLGR